MSQRYAPVANHDDHERESIGSRPSSPDHTAYDTPSHTAQSSPSATFSKQTPSSNPPSFYSRTSSPHRSHGSTRRSISDSDPLVSDADRNLNDAFDNPSDSDSDDGSITDHRLDDRQRVMSGRPVAGSDIVAGQVTNGQGHDRPVVERRVTQLPVFAPATAPRRHGGPGNDGVFANLSAKPERGGDADAEEKPPTYEQAAADATPPYWENTILAQGGHLSDPDSVYIDGLPVGSFFSFVWNGMISMSFQLVGFLLTYLLHSTHAAKNGSKAGLGITLIQYGFSLKGASSGSNGSKSGNGGGNAGSGGDINTPQDPNNHNFDPSKPIDPSSGSGSAFIPNPSDDGSGSPSGLSALGASDWFAYALMIVGWFVLVKAISEYLRARRHEALVMQSPSRGLDVAVVGEGEEPARAV